MTSRPLLAPNTPEKGWDGVMAVDMVPIPEEVARARNHAPGTRFALALKADSSP